jgi:GT2 family glycosyltransferase
MMSKASDPQLAAMTQRAIDTALDGAHNPVHVTVLEQTEQVYRRATTVYAPGDFNYNASCNRGAKMTSAPWIVFANNDLRFERAWDFHMLTAGHQVMSPYSPHYPRHHDCWHDEPGWQVGRHLSGWCFMMARWVWEELGGLDETYPFWCADNAVLDQLRAKDIQPVLVRRSIVHHTVSMTLNREDRAVRDELTWAALHQYNQERGGQHLRRDLRYTDWKQRNGIS